MAGLVLGACKSSDPRPPTLASSTKAAAGERTVDDYTEVIVPALDRAKREGKAVLLYFYTCITGNHERFHSVVLGNTLVAHWIADHCVFVEVSLDGSQLGIIRRYKPNDSGLSLLLRPDGEPSAWVREQYDPSEYLGDLKAAIADLHSGR